MAEAKSDDYEGSIKTATFVDRTTDSLVVNQSLCLDESKSCEIEIEEPLGLHFPHIIAGESREVESCSEPDGVSSVKPEMVINCSFLSSMCATCDGTEHKDLENPDESHILTKIWRGVCFLGTKMKIKKPVATSGDSNGAALDKTIKECNSTGIKEEDYVARSDVVDTNFSVKKDGPEDVEETMELRKEVSGLVAAMAYKSLLLKNSKVGRVGEHEEAFRSELNLLITSKKRKTVTEKKESNSMSSKQLIFLQNEKQEQSN